MTDEQIQFILDCIEPLVALGIINLILLFVFSAIKIFRTLASIDVDRAVKKYNSNDLDFRSLYYDLVEKYNELEEDYLKKEHLCDSYQDDYNKCLGHICYMVESFNIFDKSFIEYQDKKIDINELRYCYSLLEEIMYDVEKEYIIE